MQADDLDQTYTALCQALARVGEPQTNTFLAMLCLALLVRQPSAAAVLTMIEQIEQACA